jgi:SpoVK/Ycf46/Vps4 family AAA+-type ATPase
MHMFVSHPQQRPLHILAPGTGKTMLPRALARDLGCSIVNIRLSEVIRGDVGSSERRVVALFTDAKHAAPCIVFIDEFQAMFTANEGSNERGSAVGDTLSAALAGCFDDLNMWNRYAGPESMVMVVASTNEPWAIDRSFLRPGRLERCIFVGPLDEEGRAELIRSKIVSLAGNEDTLASLVRDVAQDTRGFTGADLILLISRAVSHRAGGEGARAEASSFDQDRVCKEAFAAAHCETAPSVSEEEIEDYVDWQNQHMQLQ